MIVPVIAISNLELARQIYSKETNGAHAHYLEPVPLTSLIDLFSLYVLFSQYRSFDNTLENCFFQISSCSRAYVRTKRQSVKFPCDLYWEKKKKAKEVYTSQSSATRKPGGTQQMFIRGGSAPRTNPLPFIYHFNPCKCTVF